jgi:hypothetical protein
VQESLQSAKIGFQSEGVWLGVGIHSICLAKLQVGKTKCWPRTLEMAFLGKFPDVSLGRLGDAVEVDACAHSSSFCLHWKSSATTRRCSAVRCSAVSLLGSPQVFVRFVRFVRLSQL